MIQFQQYQNPTLDEELKVLNSLDKSFTIKPEKKSDGNIDLKIIIEKSVFSNKYIQINEDLKFLLYIKKNFPIGNPHLYCLSQIFFQDIRDINNYIESNYSQDNNNKNKNQIKGKFHLDQIYQNRHLMLFPHLFFDNVYEKVFFENSELYSDEGRKLYICEGYFLLFIETSIFVNENLKLIFFAAIKSIVHIKHYTESDIVEFTWKIKGGKNNLMRIRTKDAGNIVKIITEILKKKKIKHQITNKDFRPKEGEIPAIDIDLVEEEINKYEVMLRLKENVNNENVNYLMKLYEKAVQYYSAVNDNKYENYMSKIHDMLGNEEFTKLLNEKKDNDIKDKEDKLDNKLKGEEKNANSDMNNKKEIKDDNINKNNKEEKGIKRDKFAIEGNLKKSDLDFESDEDDE